MRRAGGLWNDVVRFQSLENATLRAARGKRHRPAVARYLFERETRLITLQERLRRSTWRPSPPVVFEIHDPKRRTISAPPFEDRVVHQALIGAIEEALERPMIGGSYACRRGKGTHRAIDHAQRLLRRNEWCLKLDVAKFFASLQHGVVLDTLTRRIKDQRVLALARVTVEEEPSCQASRGLPIGALTSQWFANCVLDRLDHVALEGLGARGYVRYMDDILVFGASKNELIDKERELTGFLESRLELSFKERARRLAPTSTGVPFLGWTLYGRHRRPRRSNVRRVRARLRRAAWEASTGRRPRRSYESAVAAIACHLSGGSTRGLRESLFGRPP
ncbi:MAG: reverse transcriptase/maturase family protein [Planctomycetota bacterium]